MISLIRTAEERGVAFFGAAEVYGPFIIQSQCVISIIAAYTPSTACPIRR
jgi:hypothetical protein